MHALILLVFSSQQVLSYQPRLIYTGKQGIEKHFNLVKKPLHCVSVQQDVLKVLSRIKGTVSHS